MPHSPVRVVIAVPAVRADVAVVAWGVVVHAMGSVHPGPDGAGAAPGKVNHVDRLAGQYRVGRCGELVHAPGPGRRAAQHGHLWAPRPVLPDGRRQAGGKDAKFGCAFDLDSVQLIASGVDAGLEFLDDRHVPQARRMRFGLLRGAVQRHAGAEIGLVVGHPHPSRGVRPNGVVLVGLDRGGDPGVALKNDVAHRRHRQTRGAPVQGEAHRPRPPRGRRPPGPPTPIPTRSRSAACPPTAPPWTPSA